MRDPHTRGVLDGFIKAAILLLLFFALSIPLLYAYSGYGRTVDVSLSQEDASATAFVPTTLEVTIRNASSTPLNAVEFALAYDPAKMLLTSIEPTGTLCEDRFIITNTIDHASGTAFFQCGTVTPYSNSSGTIAIIHAIPLVEGTTSIVFATSTHVLAHDGYGTDVTRDTKGTTITAL
jgi:hypothetical protein